MFNKIIITLLLLLQPDDAKFASSLCNEAKIYAKNNNYNEAGELFLKAVSINPYYFYAHYGYGKVCLYTGDIKNAVKHLSIAVTLDASSANGWFYLGFAYFFSKQYMNAVSCFKKAYTIDSSCIESLYNIAVMYEMMGNSFLSQNYYEKYFFAKNKKDTGILF